MLLLRFFNIFLRAHRQRLNRNRQHVFLLCGLNLRAGGKSRTQIGRRIIERHHHFKIARFLRIRGGLRRGGLARRAQNRELAHLGHVPFENFPGDRINRNVRGVSLAHIGDIRFIHFHFGR